MTLPTESEELPVRIVATLTISHAVGGAARTSHTAALSAALAALALVTMALAGCTATTAVEGAQPPQGIRCCGYRRAGCRGQFDAGIGRAENLLPHV